MNIFIGENLGNNVFKIGILCLIGIAHLPEHLDYLNYKDTFEVKPYATTNIGKQANQILMSPMSVPDRAHPIVGNMLHAIKLLASKILPLMPISGNVKFDDSWEEFHKKTAHSIEFTNMDYETNVSHKETMNHMMQQSYQSNSAMLKADGNDFVDLEVNNNKNEVKDEEEEWGTRHVKKISNL